jgi:hypothetical protein
MMGKALLSFLMWRLPVGEVVIDDTDGDDKGNQSNLDDVNKPNENTHTPHSESDTMEGSKTEDMQQDAKEKPADIIESVHVGGFCLSAKFYALCPGNAPSN